MSELPEIERSVDIDADQTDVWERIVDGDLSEEWMGVRLEPRVGGVVSVPGRDIIGTVEEVIPGESITWSWREVDGDPSQVQIVVAPKEGGTSVTVTERLLEYRISGSDPVFLARAA